MFQPELLVTYYFFQEAFLECSGQAEPSTLLSLMVPLALLLPVWIVTVFVLASPLDWQPHGVQNIPPSVSLGFLGFTSVSEFLVCLKFSVSLSLSPSLGP